jgi:hypothetical protein
VSFVATPVQCKLMDTLSDGESRIIGFGGGIRGTKTFGSLAAVITLCKVYPGSRWAVIRKDLQRLRDTTLPSFEKLRQMAGSFIAPVNQSTWNADCANGSQILFRGENIDKDPELLRFHGYEVNGFLNEEADELSERTLIKEMERAGTWIIPGRAKDDQPSAYILNTFNPCAGWPRRRFYLPWRDQTIKRPYAFIPTTQADNPFVSDAQRDAWREMPDAEYRRFVLGDWDSLTGAYYDTLNTDVLIDRSELPDQLPSHWRYWGSYDWGYAHWSVFCAWATDEDGTDILLDSVWLRKLQDEEQALEFLRDIPQACTALVYAGHDCWNKVTAHGASGETTFDIFARSKIYLTRADIDKVNGGRAVNRQLKNRRVKIVRTAGNLRGFDQLSEILPDPIDIRKPLKVDADSEGIGGDDFADAFRYGIATRVRAALPLEKFRGKVEDRAMPIRTKNGKLIKQKSAQQQIDDELSKASRLQHTIEKAPRW